MAASEWHRPSHRGRCRRSGRANPCPHGATRPLAVSARSSSWPSWVATAGIGAVRIERCPDHRGVLVSVVCPQRAPRSLGSCRIALSPAWTSVPAIRPCSWPQTPTTSPVITRSPVPVPPPLLRASSRSLSLCGLLSPSSCAGVPGRQAPTNSRRRSLRSLVASDSARTFSSARWAPLTPRRPSGALCLQHQTTGKETPT